MRFLYYDVCCSLFVGVILLVAVFCVCCLRGLMCCLLYDVCCLILLVLKCGLWFVVCTLLLV